MDETDRLAHGLMEAFERIPELELEWLTVPDDLAGDDAAVVELEVCASEAFLARTDLGRELGIRGEVRLPVALIRGRSGEELLGFLREDTVAYGAEDRKAESRRACAEARECNVAVQRDRLGPTGAEQ